MPVQPEGWNQNIARAFFAGGGLFCLLAAGRCLVKAWRVRRKRPDAGVGHVSMGRLTDDGPR